MLRWFVIWLIQCYQRQLSPRKNHGCALRLQRGRGSGCSGVGLRLVRRYGVWGGLTLLRRRLRQCGDAAQRARQVRAAHASPGRVGWLGRPPRAQRGDCDLGLDCCDPVDCIPDPGCDIDRRRHPVLWWALMIGVTVVVIGVLYYCLAV